MKKIDIIRGAITQTVQMLGELNIPVYQQGDEAKVAYDVNSHPVAMYLPYLPDNASEELIEAVRGFLDHEVAHVLFTDDSNFAAELRRSPKQLQYIANVFEDVFIEKEMGARYPGSRKHLASVRTFVFKKNVADVVAALNANPEATQLHWFQAMFTTYIRALGGHEECIDIISEYDVLSKIPDIHALLRRVDIEERTPEMSSSDDAWSLAKDVYEALKSGTGASDDKDDSDGDEEQSEDESGKGKSGKGENDDDADEQGKDDSGSEDQDGSEDGGGGDDTSSGDNDGGDGGDGGDSASGGDDGEGDADQSDGDSDGDGDSDDGDGDSSGEGGDKAGSEKSSVDAEDISGAELVAAAVAGEHSASIADAISELFKVAANESYGSWLLFDDGRAAPEVWQMSPSYQPKYLEDVDDLVMNMIAPTASKLERLLMSQARVSFEGGLRRGRLNTSALHRLNTGDDRVFRRRVETRGKDTAVAQLCDFSGSMAYSGGGKLTRHQMAIICAYGVSMMLERCKIPTEVLTFTTRDMSSKKAREMASAERRIGRQFSLKEDLLHFIAKDFGERMTGAVKARFADMAMSEKARRLLNQNCDVEAIRTAITRLSRRQESRKILLVYSDGRPAFVGDTTRSHEVMRDLIRDAEKSGVEVIGVGIQDDSVEKFYPKSVVLHSVSDLPKTIVGELSALLLK